jgi:hypothetical protein
MNCLNTYFNVVQFYFINFQVFGMNRIPPLGGGADS